MPGPGYTDDFTEIRVAAYPTDRQHLLGQSAIWTDNAAATISISDYHGFTAVRNGWSGLDAPQLITRHSQSASAQGEAVTSEKLDGRNFILPFYEQTGTNSGGTLVDSRASFDTLRDNLFRGQPVLVGFKRSPVADSRYFIANTFQGGLNRRRRGKMQVSPMTLNLKSVWPYAVEPQTGSNSFTTSGSDKIIWGVELTGIGASTTITLAGTPGGSLTLNWPSTRPTRVLLCASPPFLQETAYTNLTTPDYTLLPTSRSGGGLPPYLTTGNSYAVSVSGATGAAFWLKNHAGV